MISTRSLYHDLEFFRSSNRGAPLPLAQGSPLTDQYETSSQISRRTSPASEIDSKSGQGARKRVPVACDRCRRRKIKCSGNEGGHRGCSNCRNAGYGACQFLRVGTHMSLVVPNQQHSKPWQGSQRYSPYPDRSMTRQAYIPPLPTYDSSLPYNAMHNGVEFNTYPNTTQNLSWTRGQYTAPYPVGYEEDHSPQYAQPPAYMLPSTDPMSNINACYMNGPGPFGRTQPTAMWSEQVTTVPSTAPYPMSQVYTTDGTTAFHAPSIPIPDRMLPTPSASRGLASGSAPVSSLESLPMSALSHRSSNGWQSQTDTMSNASSRTSQDSTSRHNANVSCTSITTATTDMGFGYVGITPQPQETVQVPTSQPLASHMITSPQTTHTQTQIHPRRSWDLASHSRDQRCKTISTEELVLDSGYSHCRNSASRARNRYANNGSTTARGQLVNGTEYTRVPNATGGDDDEVYQGGASAGAQHRTSVASLSAGSSY